MDLGAGVFAWFAGLERDNSREYFAATRDVYQHDVRGGLEALLETLRAELGGDDLKVFRQQRDLRFSPDKSPYKTRTYGVILGAPAGGAGLYAELSSRGLYAGTGYHQLARDQLERFRAEVSHDGTGPELERAVAAARAAGLEVEGQTLRTAPRGYPRDHPRIDLLRHRMVIAGRRLEPGPAGIPGERALAHARDTWRAAAPLNAWLDARVGPSTAPPERRRG